MGNGNGGSALRVLIAGGGTGGHLFPGIAVAQELVRRAGAEVRFAGSDHGIEGTAVPAAGFEVDLFPVRGVVGAGVRGMLRGAWRIPRSLGTALALLARFRPRVIIGVGGYAAFPALAAGVLRRCPIVLLEQNAKPGLVTRLFARFARAVCVSFPETVAAVGTNALLTGNPIRWRVRPDGRGTAGKAGGRFSVLVFGGSAGAHRLNTQVPGAVARLGDGVHVLHQTGAKDREEVARRYEELGISADVVAFIDDMEAAYRGCDVAVCRSGATTLAEVTALGVPSVLVPYPFAAADHQRTNAQALVDAEAAWMILDADLEEERLAQCLSEARSEPAALAARGSRARALGRPDAVSHVVDVCLAATGVVGADAPQASA